MNRDPMYRYALYYAPPPDAPLAAFGARWLGRDLHPLSALVQEMRSTEQTSQYLSRLGPFFVGRVLRQSGA